MSKELQIQNKKLELIQWLSSIQDAKLIDKFINLKAQVEQDCWNELNAAEKDAIEKGLKDADEGKLIEHSEVKKKYEQWL